ncbi:MAG: hypothetical protein GQ570_01770 [Helicobacteraceae bacterium]|nr:hypothetical protein [Helicobacteraceae bacterium]
MKYIILAAGDGIHSVDNKNNLPKCLFEIENNKTVLDTTLSICNTLDITDINIVGGFEILKIMQKYPNYKYFYNEEWKKTNTLYSLFKTLSILNDETIISYSDVIFSKDIISKLINTNSMISIAYDSLWQTRYEGIKERSFEKVYKKDNKIQITKDDNINNNLLGEFTGLIYISKLKIKQFKNKIKEIIYNNKQATILELINYFSDIECIDIKGQWAETDSIQDIEHFKFGTKAETLNSLKLKVNLSYILDQFTFNVNDFSEDSNIVLKIQKHFKCKLLVVRSSALNEDTHNSSMAGNYESILKVPINNVKKIKEAIKKVILSYTKNNQIQHKDNQILVQPYLENVSMSGVVFTKNLQTSSPYYTINYDESSDTESVTSGNGKDLSTFICYKNFNTKINNIKLNKLIKAVKEIELITSLDAIDIEFAFVDDMLYILQVRPIAAIKNSIKILEQDIDNEIINLKKFIKSSKRKQPLLVGRQVAFGIMPDWNPAEIIGINPKTLSFSLYKYLITDDIWAKSRKVLGYKDVEHSAGIVSFSGRPYVDIRMSFNTFIPNNLDDKISETLVDYFINKLKQNPQDHDKVEFNIAITAYDFNLKKKQEELKKYGFKDNEINEIIKCYKELTNNIINQNNISIKNELKKISKLKIKRNKIINSNLTIPNKILCLIEDCKVYGTLPFANLARFGFIGSIFIKSLLEKNILTQVEYDNFFKSIHTIAKSFTDDYQLLLSNKLSKKDFIEQYGHLRPGTYDINSLTYAENFKQYIDITASLDKKIKENINDTMYDNFIDKINNEITSHNLDFSTKELVTFVIQATEARELAKFLFTKNLSVILDLIVDFGKEYNISREDLAYLNINDILKYSNILSLVNIKEDLKNLIEINKKKFLLTSAINLPELIFDENDIDMFYYPQLKPNFITHHNLIAPIVMLKENKEININNKIIFIENADPGYDWIFSHNIKGLVTKYGGAASHMAIRCAEFDLPAAIGCGDKIFDKLIKFNKINIDCVNHKLEGIS